MIPKQEILDRAQEWQLAAHIVEKDYVIGWLLWGLANYAPLKDVWIFKGGTCLKKCFIETYRFSEDLDFTVLPKAPVDAAAVSKLIPSLLSVVGEASGISFSVQLPRFKDRPTFGSTEGRVYYQGPLQAPPASVKLDISGNEMVVQPSVLRPIAHSYSDTFPTGTNMAVRCYGLEEVFAEKIRALGQRYRPRDLYDVVNLYRRRDLRIAPSLILSVLTKKCEAKGIPLPEYTTLVNSPLHQELEGEWANMLAHQLPALPPIEMFLNELESVFGWLHGKTEPVTLQPIGGLGEDIDTTWVPPPTVFAWGQGVALEPIRFAGANRLCVDLTYQGSIRRIEPYSLRRTRAGALLLYAVKLATGEIRSYRVDRIQGVQVSTQPFSPRYAVEFTPTAQTGESASLASLTVPAARRSSGYSTTTRPRRESNTSGTFTIQCPYCQKRFRRSKMNLTLGIHKEAFGGRRCPGSGRRGYLV